MITLSVKSEEIIYIIMFTIKSITIYKDCKYRKILEPGTYNLGECEIEDFYGPNIRLHALVGKNGSGKSSLLDMALRLMNNFSVILCRYEVREGAELLHYVLGLIADLDYEIADEKGAHRGKLCMRDKVIWLEYDDKAYWLTDDSLLNYGKSQEERRISRNESTDYKTLKEKYGEDNLLDYTGSLSNEYVEIDGVKKSKSQHLADMFFYTLATNYSMLGFLARDYADERSISFKQSFLTTDDPNVLITFDDGSYITDESICDSTHQEDTVWVERVNWITGLFHKNDGYMCPVNLNPYRDFGTIDMDKETGLTISRLCVLLGYEDENAPVFSDYMYDHIDYVLKDDFYLKFEPKWSKDLFNVGANLLAKDGDIDQFKLMLTIQGSYASMIMEAFGFQCTDNTHKLIVRAYEYLCYKILSIAKKYPLYAVFMDVGHINRIFDGKEYPEHYDDIKKLVPQILRSHTHIEIKVHQTLYFIEQFKNKTADELDSIWKNGFSFEEYKKIYGEKEYVTNIDRHEHMPPNFFRQHVFLERTKGEEQGKVVALEKLSSGERQFIYQMTAIIYHLQNLRMVSDEAIHYKNLNLVLDEIEVCYHPEYQRQFIGQLIDLLKRMKFNEDFGIHIWLTTHSPFVLSDIPHSNITLLKDGHQEHLADKTFGANIIEMLGSSFFMDYTIGAYAQKQIEDVICIYNLDSKEERKQEFAAKNTMIRFMADNVADDYLRNEIKSMYYEMLCESGDIEQLREERRKYQSAIDDIDILLGEEN